MGSTFDPSHRIWSKAKNIASTKFGSRAESGGRDCPWTARRPSAILSERDRGDRASPGAFASGHGVEILQPMIRRRTSSDVLRVSARSARRATYRVPSARRGRWSSIALRARVVLEALDHLGANRLQRLRRMEIARGQCDRPRKAKNWRRPARWTRRPISVARSYSSLVAIQEIGAAKRRAAGADVAQQLTERRHRSLHLRGAAVLHVEPLTELAAKGLSSDLSYLRTRSVSSLRYSS